jgi:hypothetical protein
MLAGEVPSEKGASSGYEMINTCGKIRTREARPALASKDAIPGATVALGELGTDECVPRLNTRRACQGRWDRSIICCESGQ